jgi:hypothetical protein
MLQGNGQQLHGKQAWVPIGQISQLAGQLAFQAHFVND